MVLFAFFFGAGVLVFHQLPGLPHTAWLSVGPIIAFFVSRVSWRLIPLGLLAGLWWSHGYAVLNKPADLPVAEPVVRAWVEGDVANLPQHRSHATRFVLQAQRLTIGDVDYHGDWRFRLSWRDAPEVRPGQRWLLPVRLRAAHGYASPGSWDYEGWLYHQGIRYTGYVSGDGEALPLTDLSCCGVDRARASISSAIAGIDASAFALGVMRALTVADRSGLSTDTRALFRNTGTSHLMAVSGLHIGLVAGLAMLIVTMFWRLVPTLCNRIPARIAGAVVGMLAATFYGVLAGMGLPTQRALIMLCVFATALILRRRIAPFKVLAVALMCVLLWHPPSIIDAGLWLSFGAVLVILTAATWQRGMGKVRQAIGTQLAITIGLWPILVAFGLPVSAVAVVVNLLVVPLFGLLIVPGSLLGTVVLWVHAEAGGVLLVLLARLLDGVHWGLVRFEDLATVLPMGGSADVFAIAAAAFAVVIWLQPPGWPLRWVAIPLFGLVWLPRAPALAIGDFQFDLLDVGQGLSAVVSTRNHCLVFDTGVAYPSGFSTANAVVIPFLRTNGRSRIDRLILSHGDRDHAGGVEHLKDQLVVGEIVSGEPGRVPGARACVAGQAWHWDGVHFEILHPASSGTWSGNNASCVLRVSNAAGSVLLSGDIEASVERRLVSAMGSRLRSDLVVAPHHGSASSSTQAFIAATDPRFVLYPAGWANRYGFPADEVVRRWYEADVTGLNTAQLGSIGFRFGVDGRIIGPSAHRRENRRYWWHDAGSVDAVHAVSSVD